MTDPRSGDAIHALSEALARFEVRDLTHVLEEGIPHYPTHTSFRHIDAGRADDPAVMFRIEMHEHNGTHVDAPAHYIAGGPDPQRHFLHSVNPVHLIGPAAVLDASAFEGALLPLDSLLKWEAENGPLEHGSAVIFNFGWHRKWALGDAGSSFVERWPGLDRSLVERLLDRRVRAVGTDCLGLDCSGSTEIPAHHLLLREDVLIMENLANLDDLPPRIFFLASPLRIRSGSGSPIRALGLVPRN